MCRRGAHRAAGSARLHDGAARRSCRVYFLRNVRPLTGRSRAASSAPRAGAVPFKLIVYFMLLIAWLSFLIWIVLLVARGGFWRAEPVAALSQTTVHAVGNAEIARRGAWPALVAVVPARNEADVIGRAVG